MYHCQERHAKKVQSNDTQPKHIPEMDWNELNSRGVYGFEPNGYGCTAEYFLACQLVGGAGHNWALYTVDAKK